MSFLVCPAAAAAAAAAVAASLRQRQSVLQPQVIPSMPRETDMGFGSAAVAVESAVADAPSEAAAAIAPRAEVAPREAAPRAEAVSGVAAAVAAAAAATAAAVAAAAVAAVAAGASPHEAVAVRVHPRPASLHSNPPVKDFEPSKAVEDS